MSNKKKEILFYNAIPMPHSLLLQKKLEEAGYKVNFWYYENLTGLYPWKKLNFNIKYYVFRWKYKNIILLLKHYIQSDLIIVSGFPSLVHLIISFLSILSTKKLAIWTDVHEFKKIKISNFHKEFLKRFFNKKADFIFVTGKTGCNIYKKKFGLSDKKIIDFPYLGHSFTKEELEGEDAKSNQKIKIFVSNRFEPRKGYEILFNALKILDKNVSDMISVRIAGIGSEYEFYKKQFAQLDTDICLLGWIEYEDYLKEMKNTDIFIHASIQEPFGIPPIDAMACGKLLIGSNAVYSCLDRIENGYNGFVYDKNDYKELANIIKRVVENPDLIKKNGYNAYLTSLKYSFDYNISAIKKIIDN